MIQVVQQFAYAAVVAIQQDETAWHTRQPLFKVLLEDSRSFVRPILLVKLLPDCGLLSSASNKAMLAVSMHPLIHAASRLQRVFNLSQAAGQAGYALPSQGWSA